MDTQNTVVALRSWKHRGDMPSAAIQTCLSAAGEIESLQSQLAAAQLAAQICKDQWDAVNAELAAANERADKYQELWHATIKDCANAGERADGLQKIVDAARAQKPYAWYVENNRGILQSIGRDKEWCNKLAVSLGTEVNALYAAPVPAQPTVCGLCGEDAPFTGTCGGGRDNPKALCFQGKEQPAVVPEGLAHRIAVILAEDDGFDTNDKHCGLYDVRWSGGAAPEPIGDAWSMDYLPIAERIAAILSTTDTNTDTEGRKDE